MTSDDPLYQASLHNAEEIIECFGGIRPMATKIGAAVTTVQGWKKRERIPYHRIPRILDAAQTYDVDLSGVLPEWAFTVGQEAAPKPEAKPDVKPNVKPEAKPDVKPNVKPEAEPDAPAHTPASKSSHTPPHHTDTTKPPPQQAPKHTSAEPGNTQAPEPEQYGTPPKRNVSTDKKSSPHNTQETDARAIQSTPPHPRHIPDLTSALHEDLIYSITQAERRAVNKSTRTTALLVGLSTLALALIFGLQSGGKSEQQRRTELKDMQADMNDMRTELENLKRRPPASIDPEPPETLTNGALPPASSLLENTKRMASEAYENARDLINTTPTDLKRLGVNIPQLNHLTQRLQAFTATSGGQTLLERSTQDLSGALSGLTNGSSSTVNTAIDTARQKSAALNQSLEGVPSDDLKAAALLLTMTQMRSMLARDNEPFSNDLALLQTLIGDDNTQLAASIDTLAPHAQKGVLTPHGLSNELKGLTGEIVVASLKGEKLSVAERAKARMQSVLLKNTNGHISSGSDAKDVLLEADAHLQAGSIENAISTVKTLDGSAADIAAPWMKKAQATLAARDLNGLLSQALGTPPGVASPYNFAPKHTSHSTGTQRPLYLKP